MLTPINSVLGFRHSLCALCAIMLLATPAIAQMSRGQILSESSNALPHSIAQLMAFLALPNNGLVASDRESNVAWSLETFQRLGYQTSVLMSDGVEHVLAQGSHDDSLKTVLFYLQMDGQPVDPSQWSQTNPYIPVIKQRRSDGWEAVDVGAGKEFDPDWRVFARSASDSKGPASAFITALQILRSKNLKPAFNVKVIMDFQEELGSPTLPSLVRAHPDAFAADIMLILDGTRHLSNLPTLTFGARGMATLSLTVFGARDNLHSGQYGNFAPNPVFGLARLLAGMKDEQGRVLIPGYYDGVSIDEANKLALAAMPENLGSILDTLGIAAPEKVGDNYAESLQYPSLNIRGLRAAWVGQEVRTLIPAEAIAEIDMRLVAETPAERMIPLVTAYIESQGYTVIDREPTEQERRAHAKLIRVNSRIGSSPFRTDLNSDLGIWLGRAMEHIYGDGYVKMRTTGGSQPIAPFITTLNVPAVSIRIPNPDNSIHAPNENLRIGNYRQGIEMCLSILTHPLT